MSVDSLFQEALTAVPQRYRQIRAEIIGMEAKEATKLDEKSRDSDWHISLQAAIFENWRSDAEKCQFIRRVAFGTEPSLKPEQYMTGTPPTFKSTDAIMKLGRGFLPVVTEIVYKERDTLTQYALDVCTECLEKWRDIGAIPVYRELLFDDSTTEDFRRTAVRLLKVFSYDSLYSDLVAVYEKASNPLDLRATALEAVGTSGNPQTTNYLRNQMGDPELTSRLRQAAAFGLAETRSESATDYLLEQYPRTNDSKLRESIVTALRQLKDTRAIIPLMEFRSLEKDSNTVYLINQALEDLEDQE